MKSYALIFAGGSGTRMKLSNKPKQFLEYKDKPIIIYTLEYFEQNNNIDGIVISCKKEWIEYLKKLLKRFNIKKVLRVVEGGSTGQESIFNGLVALNDISKSKDDIVLIHDGVRPLINEQIINDNIECVKMNGSAITVSPAIETIINIDKSHVEKIIDRNNCMLARAPQSFYLKDIYNCHKKAVIEGKNEMIDSATMMSYYGYDLSIVVGPVENIKITTPSDYFSFKTWIDIRNKENLDDAIE